MSRIGRQLTWLWVLANVFVVGAATMSVEVAAFRLFTPVFGSSIVVWGSVIGTVMAALAVGYWIGGRLTTRGDAQRWMVWFGLAAAGYLLLVVGEMDVALDWIASLHVSSETGRLIARALLAACAFFSIPMVCFGAVTPLAVHLAVARTQKPGRETGRIYALSTIGSIVGTFFASFLALPFFGTAETIGISVAALVVCCFLGIFCKINDKSTHL